MNKARLHLVPRTLRLVKSTVGVALTALFLAATASASALIINLTYDPDGTFTNAGLSAVDIVNMKTASAQAAALLTTNFTDQINVNIHITAEPGTNTLGRSSTVLIATNFATLRARLLADATGPDDATATGPGGSLPSSDPFGGSTNFVVSRAQAKALGLLADDAVTLDGTFTFGGGHSFAYDPTNRAVVGNFDFIGLALREFTEIMGRGFVMGAEAEGSPGYMVMDLFHFSAAGVPAFNTGAGRYFSIDNGTTSLKDFNNYDLNGRDAQDWASGANDAFNALSSADVKNDLTEVDLRVLEVIGYNRLTLPIALDATGLTWTTGGNVSWFPQTNVTHDGVDAARSGGITHSQSSFVEASVTGPAALSFWWKVSSETTFDALTVAMDGNVSNSISGEVNWQLRTLAVPAGAHTVRWTYSKDGSSSAGSDAGFLDQVTVALAPVLAGLEAGAVAYTENQAAVLLTATITASDADSANLASATVSITTGFTSGQDVLAMTPNPQNGITAAYTAGTGVLTLSGASAVANYQSALRSVTYTNTSENPSNATRTVTFRVNDGASGSNPQSRNITVAGVNDAPVLASIGASAVAYTENQAATLVTATITVTDADSATLTGGTVSLSTNFASGQDVLGMNPNPQNGITATYSAGTGVLTLSGSSTVVSYRTALRSVSYTNTSDTPSTALRTVTILANDGAVDSNPQSRNLTVAAVNDAPVLANLEPGALGYAASQAATPVTATLTASDADSTNLVSGTVSLTAGFNIGQDLLAMTPNPQNGISASYNAGSGVMSLIGASAVSNYQAALRSVTYSNSSANPSTATRTVTFLVNDSPANSNPQARNITVSGPSLIPPITPTNGGVTSILLFVDDPGSLSPYKTALDFAGLGHQYFTNEALFSAAVAASNPVSTLVIVNSTVSNHNFSPLITFVANGGRAILQYQNLDGDAALAAAFNVAVTQDVLTPLNLSNWDGTYFFARVASPLILSERGNADDGDRLRATPGGVAVAGYTAVPEDAEAAVVIGNAGRTIVNALALENATSAPAQASQFALNEIFYLLAPLKGGGRVAVLGAEPNTGWNEDVRQKLLSTAAFEAVDVFQVDTMTPTLAQLRPYSAVLVYSDLPFDNATTLGDVLADYTEAGGGIVVCTFALHELGSGYGVEGRLRSGGYLPFVGVSQSQGTEVTMLPDQTGHPILAGVGSMSGGSSSFHNIAEVASHADLIAHWSNGRPLIMNKLTGLGRVAGLNFFPPSETLQANLWRTNSGGGQLMANALRWAALPDCTLKTNYTADLTFTDSLGGNTMSLAFDGTNFWSASGGDTNGNRLARYTAAGTFVASYAPAIDFRSLFTDARGRLYARGSDSPAILRQTTPGTFLPHLVLNGGPLDEASAVVLSGNANEYLALNNGVVSRWSTNGSFLGTVTLDGFGTLAGESSDYQNVRLAAVGNVWLTGNGSRVLSVWNQSGARLATTVLQNAGTGFDSKYSFSYCAGRVWIVDAPGGSWRGYDICTSPERPVISNPARVAGGRFQFDLRAPPARSYTLERTADLINWVTLTNFVPLAPNTAITDDGTAGQSNLFYRARTP